MFYRYILTFPHFYRKKKIPRTKMFIAPRVLSRFSSTRAFYNRFWLEINKHILNIKYMLCINELLMMFPVSVTHSALKRTQIWEDRLNSSRAI